MAAVKKKSYLFIQMIDTSQASWGQAALATCCAPADLNIGEGILFSTELLLHLSAETVSKSLPLLLHLGCLSSCPGLTPAPLTQAAQIEKVDKNMSQMPKSVQHRM